MTVHLQRTERDVLSPCDLVDRLAIRELVDPYAHSPATDSEFSSTWVDRIDSHPLSVRSRDCSACVAS
jgi:hypothetical protein